MNAPPNLALRLEGDTSSLTICRTCMVTGRKADELQGRDRLLSPSHTPQLHPSLVPPQDSSSDPHHTPPGSQGPGFWHLGWILLRFKGTGELSRHLNVPAHACFTWKQVAAPTCNSVLAAQETAQLHTRQLQKVVVTACFGSERCRLLCDVCGVLSWEQSHFPLVFFFWLL